MSKSHMPNKTNYSQADTKVFINRTVEGGEAGQGYSVQVLRTGASKRGGGSGRDGMGSSRSCSLQNVHAGLPSLQWSSPKFSHTSMALFLFD